MTRILGIDPGKDTGIAMFNIQDIPNWDIKVEPGITHLNEVKIDELYLYFENLKPPDIIVIEDYKIRTDKKNKGFKHQWASPFPLKIIGAVDYYCWLKEVNLIIQQPSIKTIGYNFAKNIYGVEWKKQHQFDAAAHVLYYIVAKLRKKVYPANSRGV